MARPGALNGKDRRRYGFFWPCWGRLAFATAYSRRMSLSRCGGLLLVLCVGAVVARAELLWAISATSSDGPGLHLRQNLAPLPARTMALGQHQRASSTVPIALAQNWELSRDPMAFMASPESLMLYPMEGRAFTESPDELGRVPGASVTSGDFGGDATDSWVQAWPNPESKGMLTVSMFEPFQHAQRQDVFAPQLGAAPVELASGDLDGDGNAELVVGSGPGVQPWISVFRRDIITGRWVSAGGFQPFDSQHQAGVSVASGDVNADGADDIVAGNRAGRGHVRLFSGRTFGLLDGFWAFDSANNTGARVAAGDVDGNGRTDILVLPTEGNPRPYRWVELGTQRTLMTGDLPADMNAQGLQACTLLAPDAMTVVSVSGSTGVARLWGYTRGERRSLPTLNFRIPNGMELLGASDVDRDGQPDLIWMHTLQRTLEMTRMAGTRGVSQRTLDLTIPPSWRRVGAVAAPKVATMVFLEPNTRRVWRIFGSEGDWQHEAMWTVPNGMELFSTWGAPSATSESAPDLGVAGWNPATREIWLRYPNGQLGMVNDRPSPDWIPSFAYPEQDRLVVTLRHRRTGELAEWRLNGFTLPPNSVRVMARFPSPTEQIAGYVTLRRVQDHLNP